MVLLIILGCASATYHLTNLGLRNLFDVNEKVGVAVSLCTTVLILCYWAATGDIILHNLLGCALCIQFISTLRFPSLKIAVVCLSLLVVYDIFWVFFSEYFFEKNVMVSVATKVAANPIYEVGKHMHMAMRYVKPTMELPIKLMIPNFENGRMMMLGLGDIALPGALVSLALRCDQAIQSTNDTDPADPEAPTLSLKISNKPVPVMGLFQHAMVGYFMGLVGAFVGNFLSAHAQPALIYLVPAVLLAIVSRALAVGRLQDVWAGPVKVQQSS
jgi:signal peptide peptidase-like protein 3